MSETNKRRFKVTGGRHGGEVIIAKIPEEVLEELAYIEQEYLVETILDFDFQEWGLSDNIWDLECFEHITSAYSDNPFNVVEIGLDDDMELENSTPKEFNGYQLYDREAYSNEYSEGKCDDSYVPCILFLSDEKGDFGEWIIETDGEDFDVNKLAYSTLATKFGEFIEDIWYDKMLIEKNADDAETRGFAYNAEVGWFNPEYHETLEKKQEDIEELWETYDEWREEL